MRVHEQRIGRAFRLLKYKGDVFGDAFILGVNVGAGGVDSLQGDNGDVEMATRQKTESTDRHLRSICEKEMVERQWSLAAC